MLEKQGGNFWTGFISAVQRTGAGPCEYGIEPLGSIKGGKFLLISWGAIRFSRGVCPMELDNYSYFTHINIYK
jgi:hypothetical protein